MIFEFFSLNRFFELELKTVAAAADNLLSLKAGSEWKFTKRLANLLRFLLEMGRIVTRERRTL
jgi:hypothetical protein